MHIYRFSFFLVAAFLLTGCDFSEKENHNTPIDVSCEPNKKCTYSNGVKVWLSSKAIFPETPFTIFSELPPGYFINNARLEGQSMYMGYIPQQFLKKEGVWESKTLVGICSEPNMLWKLTLNIHSNTAPNRQTLNYFFYVTY